jgi:hypothetical protein
LAQRITYRRRDSAYVVEAQGVIVMRRNEEVADIPWQCSQGRAAWINQKAHDFCKRGLCGALVTSQVQYRMWLPRAQCVNQHRYQQNEVALIQIHKAAQLVD